MASPAPCTADFAFDAVASITDSPVRFAARGRSESRTTPHTPESALARSNRPSATTDRPAVATAASGHNTEYVLKLAQALRELEIVDDEVHLLESRLRTYVDP